MAMETKTIQKILLATDLSEDSKKAYPYAASLAKTYNAHLTLLSCIDTSLGYSPTAAGILEGAPTYVSEGLDEARRNVQEELATQGRDYFEGLTPTCEVREAPYEVQNQLVTFVNEGQYDLVIVSSHGRTGVSRALLGSVAEYLLRHSRTPTLVIPCHE
jgi:nucleotide-binding universal stress UspA family protein